VVEDLHDKRLTRLGRFLLIESFYLLRSLGKATNDFAGVLAAV
jgi:hypothetical protein